MAISTRKKRVLCFGYSRKSFFRKEFEELCIRVIPTTIWGDGLAWIGKIGGLEHFW